VKLKIYMAAKGDINHQKEENVSSQKYWENHIIMNHILTVWFAP